MPQLSTGHGPMVRRCHRSRRQSTPAVRRGHLAGWSPAGDGARPIPGRAVRPAGVALGRAEGGLETSAGDIRLPSGSWRARGDEGRVHRGHLARRRIGTGRSQFPPDAWRAADDFGSRQGVRVRRRRDLRERPIPLEPVDRRLAGCSGVRAAAPECRPGHRRSCRIHGLEAARSLYGGDYLDDCPVYGDSGYVEERRGFASGRLIDALVDLGRRYEARGDQTLAAARFREALTVSGDDCPFGRGWCLKRLGVPVA